MKLRLGRKFWLRMALFVALVSVVVRGQEFFRRPAEILTFSDEISVGAAHAEPVMPDSGLTPAVEKKVEIFFEELRSQPHQPKRWVKLNTEWLNYARGWFDRVYPGEERFNRYASLWVGKREKSKLWRMNCREEFFPDMDDKELLSKAKWLQDQEEWQEMQAKIDRGLSTVDVEYQQALKELLGTRWNEFEKLHGLFIKDFLPKTGASSSYFF